MYYRNRLVETAGIREAEKCRSFVVFDTETTGLQPWRDRIIEIGAVRFRDGEPAGTFHTMVDPGMHIPETASMINHITDDMVAGAPDISEVLPAFEEFVGDDALVAHSIEFDLRFIQSSGSSLPDKARMYIDTVELSRQLVKGPDKTFDEAAGRWRSDYASQYEVKGHSLELMCEFFGIEHGTLHRADEDALATGKLFMALISDKDRIWKAKRNSRMAKDFEFEIVDHIGVLAEKTRGWKREVNLVSWSGAEPKIDIRDWSPDHSKMGKGISLSTEEAQKLRELLVFE